jgi:hypothetical protein
VGEHLLDVLAGEGIAAYLLPASDLYPVTRTTMLPSRPIDRLYADREHLGTAREYLARLRADEGTGADALATGTAEPTGGSTSPAGPADSVDVDAVWASIIAGYDAKIDDTTPPWPAAENISERALDDTDPDLDHQLGLDTADSDPKDSDLKDSDPKDSVADRSDRVLDRPVTRSPDEPTLLDALDTFGADLPAGDNEGYTPPTPPPVPRPPAAVVLALLGIASGLVFFFKPELLPIDADVTLLLGFGTLLAGVITLIWRLRPGDEEDDESDDGAIV